MMRSLLNRFALALMAYSRIPVPLQVDWSDKEMNRSFAFFPLVGTLVGAIVGGFQWVGAFGLPLSVSILLSLILMLLLTGAMHEDGAADFFDGMGGGTTREKRLAIMKDSSIGTYAGVALISIVALRWVSWYELSLNMSFFILMIAAQSISRFFPLILINTATYARVEQGKSEHTRNRISTGTMIVAFVFALLPSLLLDWKFVVSYCIIALCLLWAIRCYCNKKIGGFTGDILGFVQVAEELLFYIVLLIFVEA